MGEAASGSGRCGRMSVERVVGLVRRGWGMVRGRSGMEVAKRIMRFRGGMVGGEGEDEEAIWWCWGGSIPGVCKGEQSVLEVSSRRCWG